MRDWILNAYDHMIVIGFWLAVTLIAGGAIWYGVVWVRNMTKGNDDATRSWTKN